MAFFLIPLAIGGALGGLSLFQGKQQADQYGEAADLAKEEADREAQRLYAQEEQERMEHASERKNAKREQRRRRDLISAQYAKSGVTVSGSPTNVLKEQATQDELRLRESDRVSEYRQRIYSWNAKNSLIAGENRAAQLDQAGKSAQIQSYVDATMSVAGGAVGAFGGANALLGQMGLGAGAQGGPLSGLTGGGGPFGGFTNSTGFLDLGKILGTGAKQKPAGGGLFDLTSERGAF